jgi:hypothetical protein
MASRQIQFRQGQGQRQGSSNCLCRGGLCLCRGGLCLCRLMLIQRRERGFWSSLRVSRPILFPVPTERDEVLGQAVPVLHGQVGDELDQADSLLLGDLCHGAK